MFLMFQSSGIVSSPREWGCSSYPAGRYQIFFSSFNCHDYIWPSPYCLKHNIKILFNPGNMHKVFQGQTFEPRSDFLTWATPGSSPTCVHLSKAHIHTGMLCCMYFTASAFFDLFRVHGITAAIQIILHTLKGGWYFMRCWTKFAETDGIFNSMVHL